MQSTDTGSEYNIEGSWELNWKDGFESNVEIKELYFSNETKQIDLDLKTSGTFNFNIDPLETQGWSLFAKLHLNGAPVNDNWIYKFEFDFPLDTQIDVANDGVNFTIDDQNQYLTSANILTPGLASETTPMIWNNTTKNWKVKVEGLTNNTNYSNWTYTTTSSLMEFSSPIYPIDTFDLTPIINSFDATFNTTQTDIVWDVTDDYGVAQEVNILRDGEVINTSSNINGTWSDTSIKEDTSYKYQLEVKYLNAYENITREIASSQKEVNIPKVSPTIEIFEVVETDYTININWK